MLRRRRPPNRGDKTRTAGWGSSINIIGRIPRSYRTRYYLYTPDNNNYNMCCTLYTCPFFETGVGSS